MMTKREFEQVFITAFKRCGGENLGHLEPLVTAFFTVVVKEAEKILFKED
jgi:hypothetical protein